MLDCRSTGVIANELINATKARKNMNPDNSACALDLDDDIGLIRDSRICLEGAINLRLTDSNGV